MYIRGRLIVEVELTESDSTDYVREPILSDLWLDYGWQPKWMKIPYVGVTVTPSIRLGFPTSIVSRSRSMMLSVGPAVTLSREFKLLKGKWLNSISLLYAFRPTKYFHEYRTQQVDVQVGCTPAQADSPYCLHNGMQNIDWRFVNTFAVSLKIMPKLTFDATLMVINDLAYNVPEQTVETASGLKVTLPESEVNHRGALWGILEVGYDLFDWLGLAVGLSTYHPQLTPESDYYAPFFNRYAQFYFDVKLPVDKFVSQVGKWAGKR